MTVERTIASCDDDPHGWLFVRDNIIKTPYLISGDMLRFWNKTSIFCQSGNDLASTMLHEVLIGDQVQYGLISKMLVQNLRQQNLKLDKCGLYPMCLWIKNLRWYMIPLQIIWELRLIRNIAY